MEQGDYQRQATNPDREQNGEIARLRPGYQRQAANPNRELNREIARLQPGMATKGSRGSIGHCRKDTRGANGQLEVCLLLTAASKVLGEGGGECLC